MSCTPVAPSARWPTRNTRQEAVEASRAVAVAAQPPRRACRTCGRLATIGDKRKAPALTRGGRGFPVGKAARLARTPTLPRVLSPGWASQRLARNPHGASGSPSLSCCRSITSSAGNGSRPGPYFSRGRASGTSSPIAWSKRASLLAARGLWPKVAAARQLACLAIAAAVACPVEQLGRPLPHRRGPKLPVSAAVGIMKNSGHSRCQWLQPW